MSWEWRLGTSPDGTPRKPWRCQVEAFEASKEARQKAFLIEMGMGKTKLVINLAEYHRARNGAELCLILGPKDLGETWKEQVNECVPGVGFLDLSEYGSSLRRMQALYNLGKEAYYIFINYEGAVGLLEDLIKFVRSKKFIWVADESTKLKHWHTRRTRAAKKLADRAYWRYIMTGSPTPQGPQDIYGQYWCLDDTIFGPSFVAFRYDFMITNKYNGIIGLKPEMHEEFYRRVHAPAVVMKKADYLDLPPKVYEVVKYDLNKEERAAYNQFSDAWYMEFAKNNTVTKANNALTASLRLAQICTGFCGSFNTDMETVETEFKKKSKLETLEDIIERLDGKFVIWCAWKKNVRDVMGLMKRLNIKAVDYYGDTEDPRANELAFRKDPNVRAFVGTPSKGGLGLNLQGPDVKTVIYYSQTYNAEHRQQSEDRVHRGEIKHSVTVIDMVARNTIEETIVQGLKNKWKFQDKLMTNPQAFMEGVICE